MTNNEKKTTAATRILLLDPATNSLDVAISTAFYRNEFGGEIPSSWVRGVARASMLLSNALDGRGARQVSGCV